MRESPGASAAASTTQAGRVRDSKPGAIALKRIPAFAGMTEKGRGGMRPQGTCGETSTAEYAHDARSRDRFVGRARKSSSQ